MSDGTKTLPVEQFRGCLAHMDNPNASERGNALRLAMKLCNDAGLIFPEACAASYGEDTGRAAELQAELEKRELETAQLIDSHAADIAELRALVPAADGVKGFIRRTWNYPQCRLVMFSIPVGFALCASQDMTLFGGVLLVAAALWMFLLWCTAQHQRDGYGPLLVKALLLCAGILAAWNASRPDAGPGMLILIGVTLLLAFRLIENVMKRLGEMPVISDGLRWLL